MAADSDIVTAKFIMGFFGLLIAGAVVAHSLVTKDTNTLKEGILFASNIVMFFLGRSTARGAVGPPIDKP